MTFQVDLGTLESIHDQLNVVHSLLQSSTSTAEQYHGRLGSKDLEDDLKNFFGDWSDYWNKMENNIGNVLTTLQTAIEAYRQTDDSIGQVAAKAVAQVQQAAAQAALDANPPQHQGGAR